MRHASGQARADAVLGVCESKGTLRMGRQIRRSRRRHHRRAAHPGVLELGPTSPQPILFVCCTCCLPLRPRQHQRLCLVKLIEVCFLVVLEYSLLLSDDSSSLPLLAFRAGPVKLNGNAKVFAARTAAWGSKRLEMEIQYSHFS